MSRFLHNLALIGFMGSGKSTVGRQVAAQLHYEFVDTDDLIEKEAGKSISQIFAQEGEAAFREIEKNLVARLAERRHCVFSTGGGLGANADHVESLRRHALVVCLWASPKTIWERVKNQSHRPLLQGADAFTRIETLLAQREPVYKSADILVATELRSVKEIASTVVHQYQELRSRLS